MLRKLSAGNLHPVWKRMQLKARGEMSLARLRVFSENERRVASRNALLRFDFIYLWWPRSGGLRKTALRMRLQLSLK
jgi:hypothetical protein